VTKHRSVLLRSSIVAITLLAWLSISNHCALGALEGGKAAVAHTSCHGGAGAPTKTPAKGEASPCCKTLRATLSTLAKAPSVSGNSGFSFDAYFACPLSFLDEFRANRARELDTGPPVARSFAESVLQRSILAHAPPGSLS